MLTPSAAKPWRARRRKRSNLPRFADYYVGCVKRTVVVYRCVSRTLRILCHSSSFTQGVPGMNAPCFANRVLPLLICIIFAAVAASYTPANAQEKKADKKPNLAELLTFEVKVEPENPFDTALSKDAVGIWKARR